MKIEFKYDQIKPLLKSGNPALIYFTRRDLLKEKVEDIKVLWNLPEAKNIVKKQREDGSWHYQGKINKASLMQTGYDQYETLKRIGILINKYGFTKDCSSIKKAANFLFSHQSKEGDFRGIYCYQYVTTYTPVILELLLRAGFTENDHRIQKGLKWLLEIRQNDGGWAIPCRTKGISFLNDYKFEIIEPDRKKPFSHLVTGMVLRAFAESEKYKNTKEIHQAALLLLSRFHKRDVYPDRNLIKNWYGFTYPYLFTDLLTSLDALSKLGFSASEPHIARTLNWFKKQSPNGAFKEVQFLKKGDEETYLWVTLQICRVFERYNKNN